MSWCPLRLASAPPTGRSVSPRRRAAAGTSAPLPRERGGALTDDPEDPPHERVDPAEERIRPWPEVGRRVPRDRAGRGDAVPKLAGVVVPGTVGEWVRDSGVKTAWVLARGDRVEDRGDVCLVWGNSYYP